MGAGLCFCRVGHQELLPNGQTPIGRTLDPEYDTSGLFQNQRTLSQVKMPRMQRDQGVTGRVDN